MTNRNFDVSTIFVVMGLVVVVGMHHIELDTLRESQDLKIEDLVYRVQALEMEIAAFWTNSIRIDFFVTSEWQLQKDLPEVVRAIRNVAANQEMELGPIIVNDVYKDHSNIMSVTAEVISFHKEGISSDPWIQGLMEAFRENEEQKVSLSVVIFSGPFAVKEIEE